MAIKRKTVLADKSNYGSARPLSAIKYIVLHYTANDGDTAGANARYFQGANRKASAHYFVDDDSIIRSVPDNYVAWSVGGARWNDYARTGGGKLYGIATNANTINIEMCDTKKDGKYQATEQTLANAAILCRKLMEKYHIDIGHVIRHFDVTGKHCPVYFMDDAAWKGFQNRLLTKKFQTDKTYAATWDCYLRKHAGTGNNKVRYQVLSDAVKKKCRSKFGYAVFRKGKTFRLMKVRYVKQDVWGRMKSGYWVPLVYKGKVRVK